MMTAASAHLTDNGLPRKVTVSVPASTANLGPGFDCLGLTLDLWNQTSFTIEGGDVRLRLRGEGAGILPQDERNLTVRAAMRLFQTAGAPMPPGMLIQVENHIPLGGGLGSSAAAVMAGLVGANALLGEPVSQEELLRLATALDGHPDNVAATFDGGLTMVTMLGEGVLARHIPVAPMQVAIVVPAIHLPTQVARAALPRQVPMMDAVFNIGRTAFVVEALRSGDLKLLGKVMEDRLHQPYRLKLIPGGEAAFQAARRSGAEAVALSGAGPSIIAFLPGGGDSAGGQIVADAMVAAFETQGIQARGLVLGLSAKGAYFSLDLTI